MKKVKVRDIQASTGSLIVEALAKMSPNEKWFKLSTQEKAEFEKASFAEKQSKKAGFVLGGPLRQVI